MIQYLKADLWRINRRIPRIFVFVIYLLIGLIMTLSASEQKNFNFIKLGDSMVLSFQILPYFLAMINLYFVFEDDFQVKTMQVAIGRGIKRLQIILVKWCEMILLSFIDCMALFAVMCGAGLCKGIVLKGSAVFHVTAQMCTTVLTVGVMTALVMIVIFQMMQLGATQLLFIILVLKPVSMIINYQEMSNETMAKLNLSRFLIGSNLDAFKTFLDSGRFDLWSFMVIFVYGAIGIGAAYLLFRKKELDF